MGAIVIAHRPRQGEGGKVRGQAGTRGEWESTAGGKANCMGDAGRDERCQQRVGGAGESGVDRTRAYIAAAAEGVGVVRGEAWSVSQKILPIYGGGM